MSAEEILAQLVAFPSVVGTPNNAIVEWIASYCQAYGVSVSVLAGPEGNRSNLFATVGPREGRGYILSGHMDVVPARESIHRRKRTMRDGVEVLRVDGGAAQEIDVGNGRAGRSVVRPAVHAAADSPVSEASRQLLDVTLDAAVRRRNPLLPDHQYAHEIPFTRTSSSRSSIRSTCASSTSG